MPPDDPNSSRALRNAWLLTITLGVGLAVATLTPGGTLPDALPGSDKLHHALGFGIMVLPLTSARPSSALWLAPLAALYGGLIEYLQPFVSRAGDLKDLVADLIGIVGGVVVGCGVHWLKKAVRNRSGGQNDGPPSSP